MISLKRFLVCGSVRTVREEISEERERRVERFELTSIGESFARVQLARVLGEEDVTSHGGDKLFTLLREVRKPNENWDASRMRETRQLSSGIGRRLQL